MATVVSDTTVTNGDGSTVETIVYSDGSRSAQFTAGPGTPAANAQTLQSRGLAALTTNATYLALGSPNSTQNTTQIQALTRESSAVIRLLLGLLDTTSGT